MTTASTYVVLFCIATAVAVAVRRVRVPYTVALVIVGLTVGALDVVEAPHLTQELLFTFFLPGLLFEAAFNIDAAAFRRIWIAVTVLAIPGVAAAIAITAALLTVTLRGLGLVPGFDWATALVFAAVVAATDPVAVTAIFRQLSAPPPLLALVEGESLLNDGTSIVFLSLILAYVAGTPFTTGSLASQFLIVTGGGVLAGLGVGALVALVIRHVDDPMIEIALTTIAAYGSFAVGEELHASGVIATVVTGMICGTYARAGMSETTHTAIELFWEYVAFALNSVVFLLIGFEVSLGTLLASWREIVLAYLALLVARALVVFGGRYVWRPLMHLRETDPPPTWRIVLVWGGLRGALSMVLALSLARTLPLRQLIVTMTTGVVLLTLLVQGLTMAPLLRRLKVGVEPESEPSLELDAAAR